jgi:hypothetical protein
MGVIEYNRKRGLKIRAKQTLRTTTKKTIHALIITLTTMIVILAGVFLALTTESSGKGYELQQNKIKNETLKNENDNLKAKLNDVSSFVKIDENEKVGAMQSLETVAKTYVTVEDNKVK